jgi:hypothetical protein
MKRIHRKYGSGAVKKLVSLSPATVEGLERLRKLFSSKFKGPTHSMLFEKVLNERLEYYEAYPQALAEDVADFQKRYGA